MIEGPDVSIANANAANVSTIGVLYCPISSFIIF